MTHPRTRTVRIYSPYPPFALTEGSFQVIADQARALKELGFQVELVHWKNEKDQEGFSSRLFRVLQGLTSDSASPELYYYPSKSDPARKAQSTADIGIYHYSFSYHWLKNRQPRPEKKVFVHFHNLESELFEIRKRKDRALKPWNTPIHHLNASKLRKHEMKLSQLADELWFLSPLDLNQYQATAGPNQQSQGTGPSASKLRLVGPTLDSKLYHKRVSQYQKVQNQELCVGIIGRYDFEPNRASLEWLVEVLAPLLKSKGFQGKILVAGKGVPESLQAKARSYSFFEILGFVSEIEEFWAKLSFLLIPQFGGSGVRIKLIEAMGSGIPVLANLEAVQPLHSQLLSSPLLFQSDSPHAWVDRILAEKPYETRNRYADRGFESALSGAEVYRFLLADTSPSWL